MPSGIYRLTFSSGKFYVGKSIDIDTRWKQHFNKFALGKAARPMQLEFDKCGPPKTEVIFHCHKDHIDLLEEWLIDQLKGPDMLNTTYPDITRTEEICELIENNRKLLKLSTWDHLKIIDGLAVKLDAVEDELTKYKEEGYIIDDVYSEAVDNAMYYQVQNEAFVKELKRLQNLGWLERLFAYKVNV